MPDAKLKGKPALVLDIGGTKIAGGVVDEAGHILHHREVPTPAREGGEAVMACAVELLETVRVVCLDAPFAIGVSTGGQVDAGGNIYHATDLIPGWVGIPLRQTLESHFGLPTAITNDGNAAALGEACFGAGRGYPSVLGLTVGTGLGGGMVIDGALYRGTGEMAGALGHVKVVRDGRRCTCGGSGCLESYVSGPALLYEYNARVGRSEALASGCDVAAKAQAGDMNAREAVRVVGEWLGFGLAAFTAALNPAVVVVGGGVAQIGESLFESARRGLWLYAYPTLRETPVLPAVLGPRAGLVGASVLVRRILKKGQVYADRFDSTRRAPG